MAIFPDNYFPPKCYFDSQQDLFKSINSWTATRGYAFITQRSTQEKSDFSTIIYVCDQSCHLPNLFVRVADSKLESSQLLFISIRQRELVKSSYWIGLSTYTSSTWSMH